MFIFTEENIGNIKNAVYSTDGMKDKHAKKIEYAKSKGLLGFVGDILIKNEKMYQLVEKGGNTTTRRIGNRYEVKLYF